MKPEAAELWLKRNPISVRGLAPLIFVHFQQQSKWLLHHWCRKGYFYSLAQNIYDRLNSNQTTIALLHAIPPANKSHARSKDNVLQPSARPWYCLGLIQRLGFIKVHKIAKLLVVFVCVGVWCIWRNALEQKLISKLQIVCFIELLYAVWCHFLCSIAE